MTVTERLAAAVDRYMAGASIATAAKGLTSKPALSTELERRGIKDEIEIKRIERAILIYLKEEVSTAVAAMRVGISSDKLRAELRKRKQMRPSSRSPKPAPPAPVEVVEPEGNIHPADVVVARITEQIMEGHHR